ncbi:MAG: hypothetical protein HC927_11675, partial [Deltaproteobacteria bacterium]|nr:hypothetical protein [Deltaproteobacteria bacterium]
MCPFGPEPTLTGNAFACRGAGNGWLVLDVEGVGKQSPECVNWGPEGKPKEPTADDCFPLELSMLPNDIPSPGACCAEAASPLDIEMQCAEDCGFAACKLAVVKMREAAAALPDPEAKGIKKTAQERVSDDLTGCGSPTDQAIAHTGWSNGTKSSFIASFQRSLRKSARRPRMCW